MKKNTFKINEEVEGQFMGLTKLSGVELWNRIDAILGKSMNEDDAHVSRFYSDENNLVIAVKPNFNTKVRKIMDNLGYTLYDMGSNGKYSMLTYKTNQIYESKNMKKNIVKLNEKVAGDYYVIAVDMQMSGWGKAKNGKSVVIISCHDDVQAYECEKALSYDKGMKYIKTCYGQKPQIKNAAHIKELDFLKCPRWNKEYMFSFKKDDINENAIRKIVAESVKKVLKEMNENEQQGPFYWSISEIKKQGPEWVAWSCVEDSSTSDDALQSEFETADEAYNDGLNNLKEYNRGNYCLEVYYMIEQPGGNHVGEYATGYYAEIHDGKIETC